MPIVSTNFRKVGSCFVPVAADNTLVVVALEAACEQQPVLGATISLDGSVFESSIVNITQPAANSTSSYTSTTGDLSLNSKVGIAVGAIVILLAIAGFLIVCCGKRRRRRVLAEKARASGFEWQKGHGVLRKSQQPQQSFFDSPQSQRPFANAWQDEISPASANVEKAYFSPYSSQYTSPVNAMDIPNHHQMWPQESKNSANVTEEERSRPFQIWPQPNEHVISSDGPSHGQDWPRDNKKAFSPSAMQEQQAEEIEMTGIANPVAKMEKPPILSSPGYGRSPLTDDEIKRNYPY